MFEFIVSFSQVSFSALLLRAKEKIYRADMKIFYFIKLYFAYLLKDKKKRLNNRAYDQHVAPQSSRPVRQSSSRNRVRLPSVERRFISRTLSVFSGTSQLTVSRHSNALMDISGISIQGLLDNGIMFINEGEEIGVIRSSNSSSFIKRRLVEIFSSVQSTPLKARELANELEIRSVRITRGGVNAFLYGTRSSGYFVKDSNDRWSMATPPMLS